MMLNRRVNLKDTSSSSPHSALKPFPSVRDTPQTEKSVHFTERGNVGRVANKKDEEEKSNRVSVASTITTVSADSTISSVSDAYGALGFLSSLPIQVERAPLSCFGTRAGRPAPEPSAAENPYKDYGPFPPPGSGIPYKQNEPEKPKGGKLASAAALVGKVARKVTRRNGQGPSEDSDSDDDPYYDEVDFSGFTIIRDKKAVVGGDKPRDPTKPIPRAGPTTASLASGDPRAINYKVDDADLAQIADMMSWTTSSGSSRVAEDDPVFGSSSARQRKYGDL